MDKLLHERYLRVKRKLFDKVYQSLNPMQRNAVYTTNGPLLVLAGAGSGKTTVLVQRISFLIKYGNAYFDEAMPKDVDESKICQLDSACFLTIDEIRPILDEFISHPAPPWSVLAITFTNKAAREIKERLEAAIGEDGGASEIWAGTFHSICMRILRRFGDKVGYSSGFSVYDTDDAKKLICECMKTLAIDEKFLPPKEVLSKIGRAKDELLDPDDYADEVGIDVKKQHIAKIYKLYQSKLQTANALDFDDIIFKTVQLLRENPDIRKYYQNKFRYTCVDEYQDTNYAQFKLCELFASGTRNIMVVGDDDQSIYKFRGATIENILNFDRVFPDAQVIKLEQNYRSSSNILNAANSVIKNNKDRKGKELWTDKGEGEKILVKTVPTQLDEAKYITESLVGKVLKEGRKYSDFAVLYRMNAQSNAIESAFAKSGIPYRVIGGMRFYDRKEIKDIVAYLHVVNNTSDDLRLSRIINEPKRKIGSATLAGVSSLSSEQGVSMFEIMQKADEPQNLLISRSADKLKGFVRLVENLREQKDELTVSEFINRVIDQSGYRQMLIDEGEQSKDRLENLEELISSAIEYEKNVDDPSLNGFLEDVALVSDIDNYDTETDAAVLMTIHSSKGLEFPVVYLPGMEDGIFPSINSAMDPVELAEERRLAYVAITRAKEELVILKANERVLYGRTTHNPPSRFIEEIDEKYLKKEDLTRSNVFSRSIPASSSHLNSHGPNELSKKPSSTQFANASFIRFAVGDIVSHFQFGKGTVLSVTPMGSDLLYEINFDKVGVKKMMATFAKLKRGE